MSLFLDYPEGKREFIISLMDSMKEGLLEKVDKMPENWDGFELRWLIAEYVAEQSNFYTSYDNRSSRKRNFHNERIVRNI